MCGSAGIQGERGYSMASEKKSRGLGRFLDFIGLVDPERVEDSAPAVTQPRQTTRRAQAARPAQKVSTADVDDLFDDQPVTPRRRPAVNTGTRTVSTQSRSARYEAGDEWMDDSRIDYRGTQTRYTPQRQQSTVRYRGTETASRTRARTMDFPLDGERSNPYRTQGSRAAQPMEYDYDMDQPQPAGYRHQMVVYDLHTVNECKDVILALLARKSVLVNLVNMDRNTAQRALDTLSGATFAINAKISPASDNTWLFTPSNVEVASQHGEGADRYM